MPVCLRVAGPSGLWANIRHFHFIGLQRKNCLIIATKRINANRTHRQTPLVVKLFCLDLRNLLSSLSHDWQSNRAVQKGMAVEPILSELRAALTLVCKQRPLSSSVTGSAEGQHCVMVADHVDTLRLSSSLLPAMLFSLWAVFHWLVHTIQRALASEDLSLLAKMIFECVPSTVAASRMLVAELNVTGIGTVQLPVHCPQYWVLRSSNDQHNDVCTYHHWLQVQWTTMFSSC